MTANLTDWSAARAPDLAEMRAEAVSVFENLPAAFRHACRDIVLQLVDFPDDEVMRDMGLDSPFDILGLYSGAPLTTQSITDPPRQPDMIFLYRRPILDYWAEHDETLGAIIRHVLIHEIGHHFGLSDADIDGIEQGSG